MSKLGGVRVDFGKLQAAHPELCVIVRRETQFYRYGFFYVDLDLLTDVHAALALKNFVTLQQDSMREVEPPQPQEPQIDMAQLVKEQQADADTRAARAELDRLVSEEFLEPTDKNLSLIRHHVNTHSAGYFSATTVNQAYQALGDRLTFTGQPAPPPAPPAPPALTKLKDGSMQMPLDADEHMMKRATLPQLYDLQKRRREASQQQFRDNSARYVGSFGSKF